MKLNISVPQKQRKNLRLILNELRNKRILNGYYCRKSCADCGLKTFDEDRKISISDLSKKECIRFNLDEPIFSLKLKLNEVEEVMIL